MNYLILLAFLAITLTVSNVEGAKKMHSDTSKPLCGLCVNVVKQLDQVLEHGGDIEAVRDSNTFNNSLFQLCL